jgi:hypothetical protein
MTVTTKIRRLAGLVGRSSGRIFRLPERASRRAYRLSLDVLEDRTTLSTFLVTNESDPVGRLAPGSLRWAIAQANRAGNQGSTITITPVVRSAITLRAGELQIRSSMTIENESGLPLTIQQGTPNARVIHVIGNARTAAVTLAGVGATSPITLAGGNVRNGNGGGILVDNPQNILTLTYVNVVGNSVSQGNNPKLGAKGNGGGIYSSGTVTLDHTSVSGNIARGLNSASGHAGGVYTDQGITLVASHVDGNSSLNSAGILNVFGSVEVLAGSTVNDNSGTGDTLSTGNFGGGGISEMSGNVLVSNSQVNNNKTDGMFSGGIVILLGGVIVTDGSQVDGNTNNGPGGGIAANFEGAVTISHGSQVDGNTSGGIGNGIVNFSESFGIDIIDHSEVSGNTSTGVENSLVTDGLIMVSANPQIRRALISGGRGDAALADSLKLFLNACAQRTPQLQSALNVLETLPAQGNVQIGGGIAAPLTGPIQIREGSSVSNNHFGNPSLPGVGGGVFANLGPITIDSSTISGNVATSLAGGIWNGGSLTITNSGVTDNQAVGQGGGIFNRGAFASTNTIVTANTPDNFFPPIVAAQQ